MIKVTDLTEEEINKIGLTYADYIYPDNDRGMFPFEEKERLVNYINAFARACMQADMLYTISEKHEGYIALSTPDTKYPLRAVMTLMKGMLGALGFGGLVKFMKFLSKGGESIESKMKREKRKCVTIELLAVMEEYQCQGYMRTLMNFAFEVADQYGLPCIVDTDEGTKRDKYCHLGVHQVVTRNFGDNRYSYGMIREGKEQRSKMN